jgi:cell division protein FtsI (penicillin-binding protein 3)
VPKAPSRISLLAAGYGLAALAVVLRAGQLQLFQGSQWRARAAAQQTLQVTLPARRGTIEDRNGLPLALSQESFTVGVAPREVDDPGRAAGLLAGAVGRPRSEVVGALQGARVWIEYPGPYAWTQVAPLRSLRGVYLLRRLQRFYPRPDLAPRLVGRVDGRGRGGSGLERALDSVLAGRAGNAVMLRDHRGRTYPSPSRPAADPLDGANVVLTLDAELQEIAERALAQAVRDAKASGGDVVILQPRTGEMLALASVRQGAGSASGVIADPYEPGSTAKVFTAAALLRLGKATPRDTVFAENGTWQSGGRTIHDTHQYAMLTLDDVIRVSSNIGIAKLGARLTRAEQYEALRDFGFGSPTGVEFPGEAPGRLRHPRFWSETSAASLAMGYELAVTPLQLAAAYGALANGGVLLEPTLIREVREPDGTVRWRHDVRPVRRVVNPVVAAQLEHMLRVVVEEGTGRRAALGTYPVAGKTGTVRRTVRGRYEEGRYTASMVGLFPDVDPQLVLLVKIDDPEGPYFGGSTAAPVVREILEAALATPSATLDRARLARRRVTEQVAAAPEDSSQAAVMLQWPLPDSEAAARPSPRPVPDVVGHSLRAAARELHRAGFRVRVEGWGRVTATSPAAGAGALPGSLVVVRAEVNGAL